MKSHRNTWSWWLALAVATFALTTQFANPNALAQAQDSVVDEPPSIKQSPAPLPIGDPIATPVRPNGDAKPAVLSDESQKSLDQMSERAVKFILAQHKLDPTFKLPESHQQGGAALVGLALLKSGLDKKHEVIHGTEKLLDDTESKMIYGVSLELLFRVELGLTTDDQKAKAETLAQSIVDSSVRDEFNKGTWSYAVGKSNSSRGDHSNTSFALWALTTAARKGVKVEKTAFTNAVDHFLSAQNADGGWSYIKGSGKSTRTMTSGCLAALLSCSDVADGYQKDEVSKASQRGVEWLTTQFGFDENATSNGWQAYYLMHLRHAAREAKLTAFGQHQMLELGVKSLAKQQEEDGSWHEPYGPMNSTVPTSMTLLFLHDGPPAKTIAK